MTDMKKLSGFSVILVFVVLSVVGIAMIPLLTVKYSPDMTGFRHIGIVFSWPGASAELVESEVTSRLEGLVSTVNGVSDVTSNSSQGAGNVSMRVKDGVDMDILKFEIASLIRQVYGNLPEGVSYPEISSSAFTGTSGEGEMVLSYEIFSEMPGHQIKAYFDEHVISELAKTEGVSSVSLTGANSYYIEVRVDPVLLKNYGIDISAPARAIAASMKEEELIGSVNSVSISLRPGKDTLDPASIPVATVNGRIIRLGDISVTTLKEAETDRIYRVNGKNSISLSVYAENGTNIIEVADAVKARMAELSVSFPEGFTVVADKDSSSEMRNELRKIYFRTISTLVILLLFVLAVSRSFRYLLVIFSALVSNILISFIFYVLFGTTIHMVSLAGITISMGMVIDASIMMLSHYGYYRNRKFFIAILAAQLATIGSLLMIYLLPETLRSRLEDFVQVIVINLTVSMFISMTLIPALSDALGMTERKKLPSVHGMVRIRKLNSLYRRYISVAVKFKPLVVILLILVFGIPFSLLPGRLGPPEWLVESGQMDLEAPSGLKKKVYDLYNGTLGKPYFRDTLKGRLDTLLGGTLGMFMRTSPQYNIGRNAGRPTVSVNAIVPSGYSIRRCDEMGREIESFLRGFDILERYELSIMRSFMSIRITFKPEFEYDTGLTGEFEDRIEAFVNSIPGVQWNVIGAERGGGVYVYAAGAYSQGKSSISINGYNYGMVKRYCEDLALHLEENDKVDNVSIVQGGGFGGATTEFVLRPDKYSLMAKGFSPSDIISVVNDRLYSSSAGFYYDDSGEKIEIRVVAKDKDIYDISDLESEYIETENGIVRFNDLGSVEKRNAESMIYKSGQQYSRRVEFDYDGTFAEAGEFVKKEEERLNNGILGIGFYAGNPAFFGSGFVMMNGGIGWIVFMIIAVIFFVCAVLFESVRLPFAVIGLVPFAMVGTFLTYTVAGFNFDEGGMAAMVMLCGLSVNAGIYVASEYRNNLVKYSSSGSRMGKIDIFIRSFNIKIIPILLTVFSTFLGLTPFLVDAKNELFWFSFAVGTMGGLVFSIIGLVLLLPVWLVPRREV